MCGASQNSTGVGTVLWPVFVIVQVYVSLLCLVQCMPVLVLVYLSTVDETISVNDVVPFCCAFFVKFIINGLKPQKTYLCLFATVIMKSLGMSKCKLTLRGSWSLCSEFLQFFNFLLQFFIQF